MTTTDSAALLECEKLLGAEALVVDLRCGLDEVLQVGAGEEVAEVDEFAVVLVLDYRDVSNCVGKLEMVILAIDNAPAVLSAADLLATNHDGLLGADHGEWDHGLHFISTKYSKK